jgi:hypothetical protein
MFNGMVVETRRVLGKYKYGLALMLFLLSLGIRWKLCSVPRCLVGLLYFARLSSASYTCEGNGWN